MELSDDRTGSAAADILGTLLEEIRPPEGAIPSPGFCERVLSRIEQIEQQSIWIPVVYARFPRRATSAFLVLSLAAMVYLVAAEWKLMDAYHTYHDEESYAIFSPSVEQQRDAVLKQFVAYSKHK